MENPADAILTTNVILTTIATGAVASLVASVIFLAFLRAIRPRVTICPSIALTADPEGRGSHSIKVINNSLFPLIEIDARLDLVRRLPLPPEGQPLLKVTNIPLRTPHLFTLNHYRPWRPDPEAKYAVQFGLLENLEDGLWAGGDFLLFRIAVTHSLSGFRKVVERRFMPDAVTTGNFHFGHSCQVTAR